MKRSFFLIFLFFFFLSTLAFAFELKESSRTWSASFEAGSTIHGSSSFRLVGAFWLPKELKIGKNGVGSLRLELDMGILDTTDTAFNIGFQPIFRYEYQKYSISPYIDFGAGINFLTRAEIKGRKFSGGHQFAVIGGTGLHFKNGIELGYRFHHISNANTHSHNHGRDEHLGIITICF